MYAIIQDGGHQFRVEPGKKIVVEYRNLEPGETVTFEQVCLVGGDGAPRVGNPLLAGVKVEAKVTDGAARGPKLYPAFYKTRKHTRRRIGHRQHYTEVEITGITG